jgi:enoyl-CoA hydratase/carnithine racemase
LAEKEFLMLLVDIADRVGTITFDRDDKRNALCEGMVVEFAAAFAAFAATPARHGVPHNVTGLLTFLNAANLSLASEMLFTAEPVPAERLCRLGVINHVA